MSFQSLLQHWQTATVSDVVALGASLVLAYTITKSVYTLYFHPLAKYPGPFWARLSSFPSYWHTLKRDRHVWLLQLQEQYGKSCVAQFVPFTYAGLSCLLPAGNDTSLGCAPLLTKAQIRIHVSLPPG